MNNNPGQRYSRTKLSIIAINVNSIISLQRRLNLKDLVEEHDPDFVLLSETKLSNKYKINIENYSCARDDRPNSIQGGGTAALIKNKIKFQHIHPACLVNAKCLEATIIKVKINHNDSLFIIAAYAAGNNKKEFIPELSSLFKELNLAHPNTYYVLAGDLNAKHTSWCNSTNNPRGVSLHLWLHENEINLGTRLYCSLLPSYPRGNSFLDVCIADRRLIFDNITDDLRTESIPYDSDHNALKMTVSQPANLPFTLEIKSTIIKHNFAKTNWDKFESHLNNSPDLNIPANRNLSNQEIDDALDKVEKCIREAISKKVPKIKQVSVLSEHTTREIKELYRHKSHIINQINKLHKNNPRGNLVRLNILKDLLKMTRQRIDEKVKKSVNSYWEGQIRNITFSKPDKMFPQINRLFRSKGSNAIPTLSIPQEKQNLLTDAEIPLDTAFRDTNNNTLITNQVEKLNVIGAHFAATNTQNTNLGKEQLSRIVNDKVQILKNELASDASDGITVTTFSEFNTALQPIDLEAATFLTSQAELVTIFKKLNNKKSAGFDGIPNVALKHLPKK